MQTRTTLRPAGGASATAAVLAGFTLLTLVSGAAADPAEEGQRILEAAGVRGGLVVHLGCGEGKLTAALHASDAYLVHGLDTGATNVAKARKTLREKGLYGPVSVDRLTGKRLPYVNDLVNLVVSEDRGAVPMAEVMRVLAPHGVAYIKDGGKWGKTVKPRPDAMDAWTHYLHDPSNNAVSHDALIGPPRHAQWIGSPRWARHHDRMASCSAMVAAAGRMFYIFDEGSTASIELPSDWHLIARDAFNGTILWKRPIPEWYPHLWPFKSGHCQLPRRLVAVGDTVYATLGLQAPVSALDAATGKVLKTYPQTKGTEELLCADGILLCMTQQPATLDKPFDPKFRSCGKGKARVRKEWAWQGKAQHIVAVEAASDKVLWDLETPIVQLTLTADADAVFYHDGERIVRLDRRTGKRVWASEPVSRMKSIPTCFGPTLLVYEDTVLFAGGDRKMWALSRRTGKTLWTGRHHRGGHNSPQDLLVVGGLAWSGEIAGGKMNGQFTGYDVRTGEVKNEFTPDVDTYWFHHRCYRSKATDKYLLPSRTGIEFVDPKSRHWMIHHWVRGGCLYGIMPANGMVYTAPHDCACYLTAKMYGFCALTAESASRRVPRDVPDEGRLEEGPAYGSELSNPKSEPSDTDWPTYRHDALRSGATPAAVPADLKRAWETDLGTTLSAPAVAGGRVYLAAIDAHTVHALDAGTGEAVWSYTTGGRVDSPPTVWRGRVLFGSADGWVYCLRADDGELVWRFRAAPEDRRMTYFEQVESVWPVHGTVLVEDGVLTCVAGRSMFLDGGLRWLRLDPKTGRKIGERILDDSDVGTEKTLQANVRILNMPTALPDILSSDGKYVYLRSQTFHPDGSRDPFPKPPIHPTQHVADQAGDDVHLFSPTGFLDGEWFHRSYWVWGRRWSSGCSWYFRAGRHAPAGRILAVGDSRVYGYGRKPEYFKWTTPLEYHWFATSRKVPDARESRVKIEKSESLNPAGTPLTVEAWVKAGEPNGVVIARGGPAHGYALFLQGGRPRFAIRVKNTAHTVSSRETVTGKWVHLAGVLTPEKDLRLYVNGRPAGAAKASGFIAEDPHQAMEIGADEGGQEGVGEYKSPLGFNGLIDEVRVWHRALSAEKIAEHCRAPEKVPTKDDDLILAFTFNQGGTSDLSGHNNNGRNTGAEPADGKVGKALAFVNRGKPKKGGRTDIVYDWSTEIPLHVRALVKAGDVLFLAGPPDLIDEEEVFDHITEPETQRRLAEQAAAWKGSRGSRLRAASARDGKTLAEYDLDVLPRWDGMAAAGGRLYLATSDGKVLCFDGK